MPSTDAIVCENLDFAYGEAAVLRGVNLRIPARGVTCIVGPNGGGKSTLLRLALGLLRPQAGRIEVLGTSPHRARVRVGYMPQQVAFDRAFPITVDEVVRMGRLSGPWGRGQARSDSVAVADALAEVGLAEVSGRPFAALSGGQKQRALIARALACDPELLLLDEPTAMVDAHIEARLLAALRERHERMTIVLVSHDAAFVSGLVDTVVCVNRTATTHPAQAFNHGLIHELYGEPVKGVRHDLHGCGCPQHPPHFHGPLTPPHP